MQLTSDIYSQFLTKALYPCVRVRTAEAGGSGQVIHSTEKNGTFILTAEHVISSAISIKDEWSSVLQKEIKRDVRSEVDVEFFKYAFQDRAIGGEAVKAEIVAYDKNEDIAILRLKDPSTRSHVVEMLPKDADLAKEINYFDETVTIGAAMGHPPIATVGNICSFNDIIDNRDYMLSSAPSIFGSSGGATFLSKNWKFIGMPARIQVTLMGFSASPITHMGYIVPIWRIWKFIEDQLLKFLYDDKVSYEDCKQEIKKKREQAEAQSNK
jgi:S1-C subfamily serine protease